MAVVLVIRPYGLLGKPEARPRVAPQAAELPIRPASRPVLAAAARRCSACCCCCRRGRRVRAAACVTEILILALFAASLHFIMSIGGLVSFGHAAYFGIGAYACALLVQHAGSADGGQPGCGAARRGGGRRPVRLVLHPAVRRLPGHADARLRADRLVGGVHSRPGPAATTAFSACGRRPGSGRRPPTTISRWRWSRRSLLLLRRAIFSPFGYALRAGARLAAALGGHRHRRAPPAVGGVRAGGCGGRAGRRAARVSQGQRVSHRAVPFRNRSMRW